MVSPPDWLTYERAFRALLWRYRPPRLQQGVEQLMRRNVQNAANCESLAIVYAATRRHTINHLVQRRQRRRTKVASARMPDSRSARQIRTVLEESIPHVPPPQGTDFHCDSGLGGLARWLRAAGFDARFWPSVDDDELLRETWSSSAILLTTDGPLMTRSAVAWGAVSALLVPHDLGKGGQFEFVKRRLSLPRKTPRCMACGGQLAAVEKETVRDRIPPRTYPWLDEYYECLRCRKLFWPGTHWQNVLRRLAE